MIPAPGQAWRRTAAIWYILNVIPEESLVRLANTKTTHKALISFHRLKTAYSYVRTYDPSEVPEHPIIKPGQFWEGRITGSLLQIETQLAPDLWKLTNQVNKETSLWLSSDVFTHMTLHSGLLLEVTQPEVTP